MARTPADPFGFAAAINWNVVEKNVDKIARILGIEEHDGCCEDSPPGPRVPHGWKPGMD